MSAREVDRVLRGLPLSDKIGSLIVALCSQDKDAITAIHELIAAVAVMAKQMNVADRYGCAEMLRSASDEIEHEYQPLTAKE